MDAIEIADEVVATLLDADAKADPTRERVDELVSQIDAKHGSTWDLYRSAMGEWCFKLENEGVVSSSKSLSECLESGLAYTALPKYPRKPTALPIDQFEVKKSGYKWSIYRRRNFICGHIATRKEAENAVTEMSKKSEQEREAWDIKYGPLIAGKIEGVDFRYED